MTQMKFVVKLGSEIIGFSDLEYGDPSMGCASGRFVTTPSYFSIQQYCIEHSPDWEAIPSLAVYLPDGTPIECCGGIQIIDLSPDMGAAGIEISICGVNHPPYADLFPEHWAEHQKN